MVVPEPAGTRIGSARAHGRAPLPLVLALSLAALVAGIALPLALDSSSSGLLRVLPLVLVGLAVAIVLVVSHPGAMVVVGFALLAFVRSEPAPVDVIFALLMLSSLLWRRRPTHVPGMIELTVVLLASVTILSLVNAADLASSVRFALITLYLLAFAVWLTSVFSDPMLTRRAIEAYTIAAAVSAAAAVLALEVGFPGSSYLLYDPERAQALFKDPNVFGPFLVPPAVILLEDIARPRLLGWKLRTKLAVFIVLLAGIVCAFSRGAWLNLAVAVVTLVLVSVWRQGGVRAVSKALAALAAGALAGLGLLLITGSLDFFQARSRFQSYDETRFGTQQFAFEQVVSRPFGYGPGQAEGTLAQSVHSLYLRVAYEQGALGAILLFVVLAATLVAAFALALRDDDVHGIGSGALLAIWVGLLANSLFVDTLHWRHLWVIAALVWYGYATRGSRARTERSPSTG